VKVPETLDDFIKEVQEVYKNPNELVDLVTLRNLLITYRDEIAGDEYDNERCWVDDVIESVENAIGRKVSDIVMKLVIKQVEKEGDESVQG